MSETITLPGVRRGTIPMLALACGVMVGNIYLCQPLLAQMAREFGVPERTASFVAVGTQIGYACGVLFVVPLGDIARPAVLVRWLMVLTAFGLFAAAASPALPMLIVASLLLASTTVVAQILMPLAPSLTHPQYRGRTIAALSTGLLLGILLSRTLSGAVAEFAGTWRASYIMAGTLTTVLLFVVPGYLPARSPHGTTARYVELLASLPSLLQHRPLLLSMGMNFCAFGAFSALWATLAFHLATPRFGLGPAAAGLFGLWGAPGAMLAPVAGRLSDRWGSAPVNAIGLASAAMSFVIAGTWGATSVLGLAVAVNFLDFGVQSGQMANQRRIFGIGETIRARLNTLYMVTTFAGGALGALAGGYAWTMAGWRGVCALGGGLVVIATLILALSAMASRALQLRATLMLAAFVALSAASGCAPSDKAARSIPAPPVVTRSLDSCDALPSPRAARSADSFPATTLAADRWSGTVHDFRTFSLFIPDSARIITDSLTGGVSLVWPRCAECRFAVEIQADSGLGLETRIARMVASQRAIDSTNSDPHAVAHEFDEIDGPPAPFTTATGHGYLVNNNCGDCAARTLLFARPGHVADVELGGDDGIVGIDHHVCEMTVIAKTFAWPKGQ